MRPVVQRAICTSSVGHCYFLPNYKKIYTYDDNGHKRVKHLLGSLNGCGNGLNRSDTSDHGFAREFS